MIASHPAKLHTSSAAAGPTVRGERLQVGRPRLRQGERDRQKQERDEQARQGELQASRHPQARGVGGGDGGHQRHGRDDRGRGAAADRGGDVGPRERLDEPLTVAGLARVARLSERTLARRFRDVLGITPLQWLLQQRVRLAQELLETSDEPVEAVARRTGFGSAASLRHHFGRIAGVSPQAYRHVFRHRTAARREAGGISV